jgi:hypothetical protein
MTELLRFPGGLVRDSRVDAWLARKSDALHAIAGTWFARMRQCGGDVRELMHDGCPTVCVDDAGFAYVGIYTAHVNVGFFHGAALADPAGLLEGTGKRMRHVKLRPGNEIDASALNALIEAAYVDIKVRLRNE